MAADWPALGPVEIGRELVGTYVADAGEQQHQVGSDQLDEGGLSLPSASTADSGKPMAWKAIETAIGRYSTPRRHRRTRFRRSGR